MEHHVQSVDDALIGGFSYKLKAGASYVTDRRSVTFFASGGNQYSSTGVKVMRFNLNSDAWMDPSTFRIQFQLNNKSFVANGTNFVLPLSWNPAVFFRRCRIIAGVGKKDLQNSPLNVLNTTRACVRVCVCVCVCV